MPSGAYGYADAINDSGVIVGEMYTDAGWRGFVWDSTKGVRDLNSLIPPDAGIVVDAASDVNNAGMILARAPGGYHAYLLTPTAAADTAPPTVSCSFPDGLWHASNVSLACTSSDGDTGLTNPADASFTLNTTVPAGTEDTNAATESRTVCDNAGNCTTVGPIAGNMIDRRAPAITISAPSSGTFVVGQVVTGGYSCTDGGSGVAGCTGPAVSGAPIDTSTVGSHTFSVTATDRVGNTSTSTVTYKVTYGVCTLFDVTMAHKAGSTAPIKLNLCDAAGNNVSSAAVPLVATAVYRLSNNAPGPLADSGNANPDDQFRFAGGSYIFNLSLKGYAQGTYALSFTAGSDPNPHTVQFQVK